MGLDGARWAKWTSSVIPFVTHTAISTQMADAVRVSMDKRHLEADPLSIICFQMGLSIKRKVKFLFLLSS